MIKTKKRIAEYGEVFTSEREVQAMLNLVKHETQRIFLNQPRIMNYFKNTELPMKKLFLLIHW